MQYVTFDLEFFDILIHINCFPKCTVNRGQEVLYTIKSLLAIFPDLTQACVFIYLSFFGENNPASNRAGVYLSLIRPIACQYAYFSFLFSSHPRPNISTHYALKELYLPTSQMPDYQRRFPSQGLPGDRALRHLKLQWYFPRKKFRQVPGMPFQISRDRWRDRCMRVFPGPCKRQMFYVSRCLHLSRRSQ